MRRGGLNRQTGALGPILRFLGFYCALFVLHAQPLESTFTYQGQLRQNGVNADGAFDFEFELFDVETGGLAISPSPIYLDEVDVEEGLFTVELDFGFSPFAGDRLWLGVAVREGASEGGYTGLLPRQELMPVPYALHSESVAMGSVGRVEVNRSEVQLRVADSCAPGLYLRAIESDGSVNCEPDLDTVYTAGSGLSLLDSTLSVDPNQVQNRVAAGCPVGSSIQTIEADGSVTCEEDTVNTNASNIDSGTLNVARFDAYSDLVSAGRLDGNADSDLLTRTQADDRYLNPTGLVSVPGQGFVDASLSADCSPVRDIFSLTYSDGSGCDAMATVQLPNDANITSFACKVSNNSATGAVDDLELRSVDLGADFVSSRRLAELTPSPDLGIQSLTVDVPASQFSRVNNATSAYYVLASFGGEAAGTAARLIGCSIAFDYPSP